MTSLLYILLCGLYFTCRSKINSYCPKTGYTNITHKRDLHFTCLASNLGYSELEKSCDIGKISDK